MRQMQVCSQGHRWDPATDPRTSEHARWNICPICGGSVEMFSLRDTEEDDAVSTPTHGGAAASAVQPAVAAVAPPPPPTEPGVPGYEILTTLGYGGMGVVYKARQLEPRRIVALKMLSAGIRARPGELGRFRREAEAAAKLGHPHLVQVLSIGEHDGLPFVAMEYMDRGSLADVVAGNPMPPRRAADIVEIVARAVQYAHEQQIIHRDLKPGNVLLTVPPETLDPSQPGYATMMIVGMPKVGDFGLAKRMDEDGGGVQTKTGAVLGTPCYMAPEQATGNTRSAGPTADVYSLGAILYECLTGKPPFQATTLLEVLDLVRSQEPVPPSKVHSGVPRDLETICLKCLEKNPDRRYPTAAALADDLRRYTLGESIVARPSPPWRKPVRWLRKHAIAAVAVLLALTTLGLTASLMRGRGTAPNGKGDPDAPSVAYFTNQVKVRGLPRGVGPLTLEQARRRGLAFRFHLRGGQVEKVEAVDRHGRPTTRHSVSTHLSPAESGLFAINTLFNVVETPLSGRGRGNGGAPSSDGSVGRPCSWEYQRDGRGGLAKEIARDLRGRIVWTFQLSSSDIGHYTDERGFVLARAASGAAYVKLSYTDEGFEKEVQFLGRTGKPRPDAAGMFGRRYEHNAAGLVTTVSFLGPRGQAVPHPLGYARITREWNNAGQLTEEAYLDLRGKPARGAFARGSRLLWTYDADGHPTSQLALDLDGKPTSGSARFGYDARGNLTSREVVSSPQASTGDRGRVARTLYDYDEGDRCVRIRYYGADGKPASGSSGAVGYLLTYDDERRIVGMAYLGAGEKPAPRPGGKEARIAFAHNPLGQVVSETYFDLDGKSVADRQGVARYTHRYDDAGRILATSQHGADGDLVEAGSPAFARRTWEYDDQGRLEKTTTYDAKGKIVALPPGPPSPVVRDLLVNLFSSSRPPGSTITFSAGRLAFEYDDRGNLEQVSLQGPGGTPMADRAGVSQARAKYDELGNLSELTTLNGEGKLVAVNGGAGKTTWTYDTLGNMTEVATYGADGNLVDGPHGVARQTRRFDDRYNLLGEAFFDADGELTEGLVGYARAEFRYGDDDRLTGATYFDTDGEPVKTRVVWLIGSTRLGGGPGMNPAMSQLEAGDVLLRYDGEETRCARLFDQRKREEGQEGAPKELQILRGGKPIALRIPAGALRGDDFFNRSGFRPRPGRLTVPGAPEPTGFIQTRAESTLAVVD